MLNRIIIEKGIKYCCEDISKIENYEEAITSPKKYCCHHKNGINISQKELIEKGLYFNRPASELIFLEFGEHIRLHNENQREETRKKRSEARIGKRHSEETRKKLSDAGKISSPKKQCTITNKMKDSAIKKYNLTIGQTFESAQSLCEYVGKSNKTITEWRSKGWIE